MNHRRYRRKFGRYSAHRTSMLYNLASSIIKHEQIRTTLPKAKEVQPLIEQMITLGKKNDLNSRRRLIAKIGDSPEVKKVFTDLASRYANRQGGYTRIIKTGHRLGDCAPTAVIQLVDSPYAVQNEELDGYNVLEDNTSQDKKDTSVVIEHNPQDEELPKS